ncbi:MAG: response regulator [Hymenobacteraceae bacterium]|nr:response regulator [Hymenobacteraceae bacterium]
MHKLNHILIVDNDEINNVFTQIILEDADICHRFTVCQSVPEAFDFLHNATQQQDISFPDLILIDLSMPEYNGFDFLESYHNIGYDAAHQSTIFILSSAGNRSVKERALRYAIVNGFLQKPLSLVMLQDLLSRTVQING